MINSSVMADSEPCPPIRNVEELIQSLDAAVAACDDPTRCRQVMETLTRAFSCGEDILPAEFLETSPEGYARRLLHRHPGGAYSVVVMVWGPGQGTPLHDHAGSPVVGNCNAGNSPGDQNGSNAACDEFHLIL